MRNLGIKLRGACPITGSRRNGGREVLKGTKTGRHGLEKNAWMGSRREISGEAGNAVAGGEGSYAAQNISVRENNKQLTHLPGAGNSQIACAQNRK